MGKQGNSKKLLIVIWIATLFAILAVSYFFAEKNSNPKFLTKVDKLIFSNENEPAKYVITLPDDQDKTVRKGKEETVDILKSDSVKIKNPIDVAKLMPKIDNLKQIQNARALKESEETGNMKPWIAYSRKTSSTQNYHKVAVIVKKAGLSERETQSIIKTIHEDTCMSFSPYARNLSNYIDEARKYGNETYMDVNIQSKDFLNSDTGPKALDLSRDFNETIQSFTENFININAPIGGFTLYGNLIPDEIANMKKFLSFVAEKGFLIIDATDNNILNDMETKGLPRIKADIMIDDIMSKEKLNDAFYEAERIAAKKGHVVIIIEPKPLNIITLMEWFETFSKQYSYEEIREGAVADKPFVVVPISSLVVE